jgi:hypothetical protein
MPQQTYVMPAGFLGVGLHGNCCTTSTHTASLAMEVSDSEAAISDCGITCLVIQLCPGNWSTTMQPACLPLHRLWETILE